MVLQDERVGKWADSHDAEEAHVVLSLVTKTALTWHVVANILIVRRAGRGHPAGYGLDPSGVPGLPVGTLVPRRGARPSYRRPQGPPLRWS